MKKEIYLVAVFVLLIDQLSKLLVTSFIGLNSSISIIDGFFSLRYIRNTGAAWGIMSNNTLILALISVFFLFFFIKYIEESKDMNKLDRISFGLILGGIVGNLFDRLLRGYVVDFFSFLIFKYKFPVFNVADTFIVLGVILMAINIFVGDGKVGKDK